MSPQVSMNRQGSSLFSPNNQFPLQGMPVVQTIIIPQYPFYGFTSVEPLFRLPDATDLQFIKSKAGVRSQSNTIAPPQQQQGQQQQQQQQQTEAEFVAAITSGRIPPAFQSQLELEQMEIDENDYKLEKVIAGSAPVIDADIAKLTSRTKEMKNSVKHLEADLERQRRSVSSLVSDVKDTSREAERGAREARALITKGGSHHRGGATTSLGIADKSLPSSFFWRLLEDMEEKIVDYDIRTDELKAVLSSSSGGEEGRRKNFEAKLEYGQILDIISQQYRAFKVLEEQAAAVHAEVNDLRKQYSERYLHTHGELAHLDFDLEDKLERDRQRRLLKKVESMQKPLSTAIPLTSSSSSILSPQLQQQQQQQPQAGFGAGNTISTPGGNSLGWGFSGVSNTSSFPTSPAPSNLGGSMFGSQTPIGGGLGSFTSPIPMASSGLFSPQPGGYSSPQMSGQTARKRTSFNKS